MTGIDFDERGLQYRRFTVPATSTSLTLRAGAVSLPCVRCRIHESMGVPIPIGSRGAIGRLSGLRWWPALGSYTTVAEYAPSRRARRCAGRNDRRIGGSRSGFRRRLVTDPACRRLLSGRKPSTGAVTDRCITYESAAAHASRTSSGSHFSAPYGRRDSGVGGIGSHARPSAAFECYPALVTRVPPCGVGPIGALADTGCPPTEDRLRPFRCALSPRACPGPDSWQGAGEGGRGPVR